MRTSSSSLLVLAAYTCIAEAQSSTSVYNNTQINIQSSNEYSAASLTGYHVGAALNYIVAQASGAGSSFTFNLSALSAQLLDNDVAAGYQLPCYVVSTSQISNNSGPLECGAGNRTNQHDTALVTAPNSSTPGTITFNGINQWYICAVQNFTYGWVQGTVVGLFGSGAPLGPGIANCSYVDALTFARSDGTATTTTTTITTTPATSTISTTTTLPPYLNTTTSSSFSSSTEWLNSTTVDAVLITLTTDIAQSTSLTASSSTSISSTATSASVTTLSTTDLAQSTSSALLSSTSASTADTFAVDPVLLSTSSYSSLTTTTPYTSPTSSTTSTLSPSYASYSSYMSSMTTVTSSTSTANSNPGGLVASYAGSFTQIATYTGAAVPIEVSALLGLSFVVAVLLS